MGHYKCETCGSTYPEDCECDRPFTEAEQVAIIADNLAFRALFKEDGQPEQYPNGGRVVRESGFAATGDCYDSHPENWMYAPRTKRRRVIQIEHNRNRKG